MATPVATAPATAATTAATATAAGGHHRGHHGGDGVGHADHLPDGHRDRGGHRHAYGHCPRRRRGGGQRVL